MCALDAMLPLYVFLGHYKYARLYEYVICVWVCVCVCLVAALLPSPPKVLFHVATSFIYSHFFSLFSTMQYFTLLRKQSTSYTNLTYSCCSCCHLLTLVFVRATYWVPFDVTVKCKHRLSNVFVMWLITCSAYLHI